MTKKFLAGIFAAGMLAFPLTTAEAYDTSVLQKPQNPLFYIYETKVDLNINEQLQRAKSLIEEEKDYRMAIAVCNQIIELDSNVSLAYLLKSMALTELKDFSAADAECQKAINIEPQNPTFHYFRGMNYLYWADNYKVDNGGHFNHAQRAIPHFKKALELENKYVNAIVGVGDAYMKMADNCNAHKSANVYNVRDAKKYYTAAIDEYNKILVWFPKNGTIVAKKAMAQKSIEELQ